MHHRLSQIDETSHKALCSVCGVISICSNGLRSETGKQIWRCSVAFNKNKKTYRKQHPENEMLRSAKRRAKKQGVPFAITCEDILRVWPADNLCPVLRTPFSNRRMDSPSLDRIRPTEGYVPGNIAVISRKANSIKQNVTDPQVFRRLADWLELWIYGRIES